MLGVVGSFVEVTNFVGATVEVGSEVGCGVAEASGGVVDVHVGGSDARAGVPDVSPPESTLAPRVQAVARAKMSAKKMSRDTLETDQRGFRQARWGWPRSFILFSQRRLVLSVSRPAPYGRKDQRSQRIPFLAHELVSMIGSSKCERIAR